MESRRNNRSHKRGKNNKISRRIKRQKYRIINKHLIEVRNPSNSKEHKISKILKNNNIKKKSETNPKNLKTI
jgi:hypothetical protein